MENLVKEIVSYVQGKYYPKQEWEVVARNHHGGFMFGPKEIYPIDEKTKQFTIKFENGFLYITTSYKKVGHILEDIEEKFGQLTKETDYFIFDHNVNYGKKYKKLPLKAKGEGAEYLLNILENLGKEFTFNVNAHGILNIFKGDTFYRIDPVFKRIGDNPPALVITESPKVVRTTDDWKTLIG